MGIRWEGGFGEKKKLMGILEEVLRRRQNRMVSCFSLKARLGGEVDEFLFILA